MKTSSRGPWRPLAALLIVLLPLVAWFGTVVQPARSDAFVDPAFTALWDRTDRPVAGHQAVRTWMWGPVPGAAKREPYAEGAGGVRLVQYFDKGRMEINNPSGDPKAAFYVTSGLLAVELISGLVQTGNARFTAREAANIPLASDRDDATAPTYASFAPVSSLPGGAHPMPDATGRPANLGIDRNGVVNPLPADRSSHGVTYAYFEPQTQHNVADVFWRFLNSTGPVLVDGQVTPGPLFQPWFAQTGLPISEAYWAQTKIAGKRTDVLIQAFQRRVLTFVPANAEGWQVEMGNIGLHYLEWRYASPAPAGSAVPPGPGPVPPIVITAIVIGRSGLDLNEQSVTLVNNGDAPVDFSGWRLVSPKNDHEDVYTFPSGFQLGPRATVVVHAGQGFDSPGQLYMRRITWLFDATGFDGVILFNGAGREVTRYFLQGGTPPTVPPLPGVQPTTTPLPVGTVPVPGGTTVPSTPAASVTAGPTAPLPTAQPTSQSGLPTPTVGTGDTTPTATPSGRTPTATATAGRGATATATPTATPAGRSR